MRKKQLTETELFRKINVLLTDKNKEQLEMIKEKISLLSNVEIDNSGFVRGVIEYFSDNPEELKKLVPYVKEAKGYNILLKFNEMIAQNKTPKEIEEELGISIEIVDKIKEKYEI
jgi:hypothetical protein